MKLLFVVSCSQMLLIPSSEYEEVRWQYFCDINKEITCVSVGSCGLLISTKLAALSNFNSVKLKQLCFGSLCCFNTRNPMLILTVLLKKWANLRRWDRNWWGKNRRKKWNIWWKCGAGKLNENRWIDEQGKSETNYGEAHCCLLIGRFGGQSADATARCARQEERKPARKWRD